MTTEIKLAVGDVVEFRAHGQAVTGEVLAEVTPGLYRVKYTTNAKGREVPAVGVIDSKGVKVMPAEMP